MPEITVTRTYIIHVAQEDIDTIRDIHGDEEVASMADAISRMADVGNLEGQIVLVADEDGIYWEDADMIDEDRDQELIEIGYKVYGEHSDVTGA